MIISFNKISRPISQTNRFYSCLKQDSCILGHISAFDFPGHFHLAQRPGEALQGPSDAALELASLKFPNL